MRVVVGGEELNANHMVTQIVECIEGGYAKDKRLLTLLEKYHKSRTNRYGTALHCVVLCCVVLSSSVCCTVCGGGIQCVVWYCAVMYGTLLCFVMYCAVSEADIC
jgi:hypothetical protein